MGADAADKIFGQVSLTSASMNWIHQTVKKKWAPKNFTAKSLRLKFQVCDLDPKVMVIGPDVADKILKQYLLPYQIHLKATK